MAAAVGSYGQTRGQVVGHGCLGKVSSTDLGEVGGNLRLRLIELAAVTADFDGQHPLGPETETGAKAGTNREQKPHRFNQKTSGPIQDNTEHIRIHWSEGGSITG
jgi:hypothetical protein